MSDLKLSVLISAIDKFSAPAQKIGAVSEQLATRLHDGQKALQELGGKGRAVQRMKALETRLARLLEALGTNVEIARLPGGLAKDSDEPIPAQTRSYVIDNWRRIEQTAPGTVFNYDFWQSCQPRRSTYPACRAVIAARRQGDLADKRPRQAALRPAWRDIQR